MGTVLGGVLLALSFLILAALNKQHRDATGVNMPSRGAMRRIRRNARRNGISEADAYDRWLTHKQKSERPDPALPLPAAKPREATKSLPRPRPPSHDALDFIQLDMMAAMLGWTLKKQAFGQYYLLDRHGKAIINPYAEARASDTDFSHRDIEDFLLTQ